MGVDPCARRNPLNRAGLTQSRRKRVELSRRHFLPDERDLADLVLFGQRFAKHVQFYSTNNNTDGDWSAFFESDITASLAALSKLPVDAFRDVQLDLETWLKAEEDRLPAELSAHMKLSFHLPLALFKVTAGHHEQLSINGHALSDTIAQLANREIYTPLQGLASWYKGALPDSLPGKNVFEDTALVATDYNLDGAASDERLRLQPEISNVVLGPLKFSEAVIPETIMAAMPHTGWSSHYAATAADPSPYEDATSPHRVYEQIYDALSYNLLTSANEQLYHGLDRIRHEATAHLIESLENFGRHAPQYGLWLTFLQLFEHARGELNAFTGRHLDFYFKEVLKLGKRAAIPDQAHLLFELSKAQKAHRLTAGTLFRAGKDALGKPVSYGLKNDIVINRGVVEQLRAIRMLAGKSGSADTLLPKAAFVVNSRDGLGEIDLAKDDPTFSPFGPDNTPAGRIGFAVADPKLFMREGSRSIILRAELKKSISDTNILPRWRIRLTGDEGWFELTGDSQIETVLDNKFEVKTQSWQKPEKSKATYNSKKRQLKKDRNEKLLAARKAPDARDVITRYKPDRRHESPYERYRRPSTTTVVKKVLQITITLQPDDPPVVPLDEDLHGIEHGPGVPVMEVIFDFEQASTARAFSVLHALTFKQLSLQTSASGLKNLMVVADGAVVDTAKPFTPFGARPRAGTPFHIGSSEIFSKPIQSWNLILDWEESYSRTSHFRKQYSSYYNPDQSILSAGQWLAAGKPVIQLGASNVSVTMPHAAKIDSATVQDIENQPLTAKTRSGFVRLQLPNDFGHTEYVTEYTRAMISQSPFSTTFVKNNAYNYISGSDIPEEPYSPVLSRLEASYTTARSNVTAFSQLQPFGLSAGSTQGHLFPQMPFSGALYIGVTEFDAPARLTLLIQVLDGSGDPLIPAPELEFSQLDGDDWLTLLPQDIDDKTFNLTGSGVVGLNLPELKNPEHRVMPEGLYWIRITALRDASALNRLLSIDAQAAAVSFVDADNDVDFLSTPLADGSISKLLVPDTAVKKITQPYASFGGRPVEADAMFETRVSERLRHKDRAITTWDYESLVLEAFPTIYRAKCLNTTELKRDQNNVIVADNELAPGAVTIVTVPWTRGQNSRDPLRPYTDQKTLTAVDSFLRKRLSPFVRLEVQNPKFEEVHLNFKVRFKPEIGDIAFYTDELNKALIAYLTPWSVKDGGDITFGGKLWKSSVIDFIDEWPHVDYITDFKMFHKVDIQAADGDWTPVDSELIESTTGRSILVSAASHKITEVANHG